MNISLSARLIHSYQQINRESGELRIVGQFLEMLGADKPAKLHTLKFPKETLPNNSIEKIGKDAQLTLEMWNANGRSGFYIPSLDCIAWK